MPINKYGYCPSCGMNWDKGDIKECLGRLDTLSTLTNAALEKVAALYGWSLSEQRHFTHLTTIVKDKKSYYKCPNIRCGGVFDEEGLPTENIFV